LTNEEEGSGQEYQWRIVSISHLDELHEEIEGPHRLDLYDEEFYKGLP
jgi:hypothetical protein